jgi:hypothetical protein
MIFGAGRQQALDAGDEDQLTLGDAAQMRRTGLRSMARQRTRHVTSTQTVTHGAT